MANSFKSKFAEAISNSSSQPTTILQVPGTNASKAVLIGLQLANTGSSEIKTSVILRKNLTTSYHKVTVAGSIYSIDGSATPSITVKKGHIYVFDVSDSSNDTHVLAFSSTNPASSRTAISGVVATGTPGTKGAYVTWTVPSSTSAAWYYCTQHSANNYMNSGPTAFTVAADTAEDMLLLKDTAVPASSVLEVLAGSKIILEESDAIAGYSDTATSGNIFVNYLLSDST